MQEEDKSLLHWAVIKKDLTSAKKILSYDRHPEKVRKQRDFSGLHCAIVDKTLSSKIKTNQKDKSGHTPFHYAVAHYHPGIFKLLLENGANAKVEGKHGYTPLHMLFSHPPEKVDDLIVIMEALLAQDSEMMHNENNQVGTSAYKMAIFEAFKPLAPETTENKENTDPTSAMNDTTLKNRLT
ncbi:MAG TPA: ankyrin repeat domain-containing protein [Gammaproteobacteria bacterium]|nr:ankyrin repeat domain-containing protein [Gammaproteobacteria bacterium]